MTPRFAIHLALWTRDWADDIVPLARKAAEIGYDGVEVSLLGAAAGNPIEVGKAITDLGLAVTCTTGLSRSDDIASLDPAIRARGIEALKRGVKAAHGLGARHLSGVIYAPWGAFDGRNKRVRRDLAAEGLRAVAPLAEALDVRLGIEAINRFETDLVNTAAEAISLAESVGSTHVGVLLDSFHMNIEEADPAAAIRATGRRLFHFHCADNDRGVPGGGKIDFSAQARALAAIGFDGWITAEMFVLPDVAVSPDLSIWRPIEADPDVAARDAFAFFRKTFA